MELALTRSYLADEGGWLRPPSLVFALTVEVAMSAEERWIVDAHHLYHHTIFDRTPPWFFPALREAEHAKERAEREGTQFEWPWYLPQSIPEEWIVTVERLAREPMFTITFNHAAELADFEPRLMAAFAQFGQFLRQYGARPATIIRRF